MTIFPFLKKNMLIFKVISVAIIVLFLFSPVLPAQKAEAVPAEITLDPWTIIGNGIKLVISKLSAFTAFLQQQLVTKEFILDPIVKMIARTILRSITQSIIKWASTGFQGNPSFVQDPKRFFAGVADQAIGEIIYNNAKLQWMCSPFRFQLKRALLYNRSFQQRAQCTLTDIVRNYEGFISGVNNELGGLGGWSAWNLMAVEPQNNPYGAYAMFNLQVNAAITTDKERELNLLNWGSGFFSWKDPGCVESADRAQSVQIDNELNPDGAESSGRLTNLTEDANGNVTQTTSNTDPNNCKALTPGSVIAGTINKTVGAGIDELVAADEIDEVLGAIVYGLAVNILGGGGLFGEGGGGGEYSSNGYLAQVEAEDRQSFANSKNEAISKLTERINDENQYIAAKNGGLARIDISANKVSAVIACNADPAASSTLSQVLANKAPIQRDIAIGENNINNLRLVIDRFNTLPYEQRNNLIPLMGQFSDLLSQTHSQGDVIQAEYERDFGIGDRFRDLDAQSDLKLQQCQQAQGAGAGGTGAGGAPIGSDGF